MSIDEQISALGRKQTDDITALGVVAYERAIANASFDARTTALMTAVRARESEIQALMVQRATAAAVRAQAQMAQMQQSAEAPQEG